MKNTAPVTKDEIRALERAYFDATTADAKAAALAKLVGARARYMGVA